MNDILKMDSNSCLYSSTSNERANMVKISLSIIVVLLSIIEGNQPSLARARATGTIKSFFKCLE